MYSRDFIIFSSADLLNHNNGVIHDYTFVKRRFLSFKYDGASDYLFNDLSFSIYEKDRIGIVGKNGSGKTTLFKVLLNENQQVGGTLSGKSDLNIGYLPQEIRYDSALSMEEFLLSFNERLLYLKRTIDNEMDSEILTNAVAEYDDAGGYISEAEIEKQIHSFGFSPEDLSKPIQEFSSGEKTRIALFRIVIQNPDLLLLDEPTNHLDEKSLNWLENYLRNQKRPYVVISHDRMFLDNCVKDIWELRSGKLKGYSGGYSQYRDFKENEEKRLVSEYERSRKHLKKLKEAARKRREKAEKQENFKASRSIKKNGGLCKRDEGKANMLKEQKMMRSAMALEKRIEKEAVERPDVERRRKILLSGGNIRHRFALQIADLEKSYGEKKLFDRFNFVISAGEKVAVCGPNGCGKSTLLKIVVGILECYGGTVRVASDARIGYYSQEYENLDLRKTVFDELFDGDLEKQSLGRTILACLNIDSDKVFEMIENLSIGERCKVALTKILMEECDFLVLDEPTNHLEISAREELEKALGNYGGTVLFVSHDRYFREKIASRSVDLSSGKAVDFIKGMEESLK